MFQAEYPAPVLVARKIIGGRLKRGAPSPTVGRGRVHRLKTSTLVHIEPGEILNPTDDDILVTRALTREMYVPIIKSPATARNAPIAIGRFASCDVVINDYTVSKRHAWFAIDPLLGHFRIVDASSTNGTFLGDLRLTPNVPTPVKSQTPVTFGRLIFTLLSSSDFFDFLRSGAPHTATFDVPLGT